MTDTNGQCQRSEAEFAAAYGKGEINISLSRPADVIDVQAERPELSDNKLFNILENDAVMSYGLTETIQDAEKVLIILPDSTRKSGAERILPRLTEILQGESKIFHFIIAVGTHRSPTEDELKKILTPEIYEKHSDKILTHNCEDYDNHDFYGITKRKTTVLINKAYREHDTVITIGSVGYHYFAGYGGGRKMIIPGIASRKSCMANHKLALDAVKKKRHEHARTGNMKLNPVHDDLVEAIMIARPGHTFFAVNTLLNSSSQIVDVTCGDLFMSHIKAAEILDKMALVSADKKYDLAYLSAGGYPKDINMVQAQKALDRIVPALADGAKVVFFAECSDGYGNSFFKDFFDKPDSKTMLDELLSDYQINRQTAYNLKTRLEAFEVYIYTDFDKADCERMGFKKLSDIKEAEAFAEKASDIAFIPFAHNILPG